MADNTKPSDDAPVATDDIGGVHHQRVKVQHGANNSATDVSTSSPLPVGDASALEVLEAIAGILSGTLKVGDGSGPLTVDGVVTIGAGSAAIGQVDPRGNVAHDGVDSGNPVKVGGKARTALVAVSAASDRVDLSTDKLGRLFSIAAPLDQRTSGSLNRTNTTAANVIAAPGASVAIVVTDILVVNAHATVGTKVSIRDGETAKVAGYAGALGGGFEMSNPDGLFVATANTAITAICGTTGADVDIFVSGYKIPA